METEKFYWLTIDQDGKKEIKDFFLKEFNATEDTAFPEFWDTIKGVLRESSKHRVPA